MKTLRLQQQLEVVTALESQNRGVLRAGSPAHARGLLRIAAPWRQSRCRQLAHARHSPSRHCAGRAQYDLQKGLPVMKRVNAVVIGAGAGGRHRGQGTCGCRLERCAAGARSLVHGQRLPQRRSPQPAHHRTGQCLRARGRRQSACGGRRVGRSAHLCCPARAATRTTRPAWAGER